MQQLRGLRRLRGQLRRIPGGAAGPWVPATPFHRNVSNFEVLLSCASFEVFRDLTFSKCSLIAYEYEYRYFEDASVEVEVERGRWLS